MFRASDILGRILFGRTEADVKMLSRGCAPINSATCARAVSITPLSFDPNLYTLDGLPHSSQKQGRNASRTSGRIGMVRDLGPNSREGIKHTHAFAIFCPSLRRWQPL
jgi:hypothetical protein